MELSSGAREGWKDRRIGGRPDRQMWKAMRAQSNLSREDRQLSDGWRVWGGGGGGCKYQSAYFIPELQSNGSAGLGPLIAQRPGTVQKKNSKTPIKVVGTTPLPPTPPHPTNAGTHLEFIRTHLQNVDE